MTQNFEAKTIIVIGAGIVGACTAIQLLQDGHRVVLLEKDAPGSGASQARSFGAAAERTCGREGTAGATISGLDEASSAAGCVLPAAASSTLKSGLVISRLDAVSMHRDWRLKEVVHCLSPQATHMSLPFTSRGKHRA